MTSPYDPCAAGGVVTVVADRAKFLAWLDHHAQVLRPYYGLTGPDGSSPRQCMDTARGAFLARPSDVHAVLNCVYIVLRAYRLAGQIDRIGQARHFHTAVCEVAERYEQAGDQARGARLRVEAAADLAEAYALESVERGLASE
ncbi:hypothetical protein KDK95_33240 [Actinospica sp. MGRD01-02]|uniref:Uncharacterized protein n=1 Tax=Actinospica acidithermotolerans TaxID=2828514 RepID=A0A941ELE3_9ACTN|nr:hypothetical protein [Actinospica acidithermotolerans]MBR7831219.1 hypothetical protein [Actinospica acidithermotolerans]